MCRTTRTPRRGMTHDRIPPGEPRPSAEPSHFDGITSTIRRSKGAVGAAVRKAAINKRASCHSLRHSLATHLLEDGKAIRTIQEMLEHADVNSTMIYTRVSASGATGVRSPLDRL